MPAAETANKPAASASVAAKSTAATGAGAAAGAGPATVRRRVPGWLIALGSAGAAVAYGAGLEKMTFGPPLVMLGLGGMTLALCGMALWRVIDPLTRADGAAGLQPRGPQRMRELEREKQAVLKAIKEIELDHQMRKIADGDYHEMIDRYRTRAMRLISEIEAGDNFIELIERELKDRLAAAASVPAESEAAQAEAVKADPAGCATCGIINDQDARFCKKCGAKLVND